METTNVGGAFARSLTLMKPAENLARDMTPTFKPFTVLQHKSIFYITNAFFKRTLISHWKYNLKQPIRRQLTLLKSYELGTCFATRPSCSISVCVIQKDKSLTVFMASQAEMLVLAPFTMNPSQRGSISKVAMFRPSAGSILFKNGILLRNVWNQFGEIKIASSYWCQTAKEEWQKN